MGDGEMWLRIGGSLDWWMGGKMGLWSDCLGLQHGRRRKINLQPRTALSQSASGMGWHQSA